jgi:2-furoyl-CoA dehydrogenase large subunit
MTDFQPATESQTGYIGARQPRVEDAALLRGLGCYADDTAIPPGTLHAAIIRSPHAHLRVTSVDFSSALLMKGVHGMLVGENSKRWALPSPSRNSTNIGRDGSAAGSWRYSRRSGPSCKQLL